MPLSYTSVARVLRRWPAVQRLLDLVEGDRNIHRFIRFSMVSGVAVGISQVTLLICAWIFGLGGVVANTVGTLVSMPASYELNRKWAWGKAGKSHLWKEVLPFWVLTLLGFLGSTGMVAIAESYTKSHHWAGLGRAVLFMAASLFAYGVVWIAKFYIFNRYLFVAGEAVTGDAVSDVVPAFTSGGPSLATANGSTVTSRPAASHIEQVSPAVRPLGS